MRIRVTKQQWLRIGEALAKETTPFTPEEISKIQGAAPIAVFDGNNGFTMTVGHEKMYVSKIASGGFRLSDNHHMPIRIHSLIYLLQFVSEAYQHYEKSKSEMEPVAAGGKMKIKMSKNQWEEIGKQGGWIKTASLKEDAHKWWGSLSINQMKELTRKYFPDPHITWSFIDQTSFVEDIYKKENNITASQNIKQIKTALIPDDGYADGGEPYTPEEMTLMKDDDTSRRRSIKVTFSDAETITTEINGTKQEIKDYYLNQSFVKQDENTFHQGVKVEFLS